MGLQALIEQAKARDVAAFTELTRRYQNMAFGYAVSLLGGERHLAEDAVQEAFVAAYFNLEKLQDATAFPCWLRGIVRHQCHRILRRRCLEIVPLEYAAAVASSAELPEQRLERAETRRAVLVAIDALPHAQREVITLFYLQEQSQQEVATFLGVPVTTVNNRLHAARTRLKRRLLQMAEEIFKEQALPADFAARIGKIVQVRGPVVDAQFDPAALPELLSALTITEEPRRIDVVVAQRLENGVVRCIAASPVADLQPGTKIARSEEPATAPISDATLERAVEALTESPDTVELLETGIKVIDLLCPYAKGGKVGIFGDMGVGKLVLIEEIVRKIAEGGNGLSLFTFVQGAEVSVIQEGWTKDPLFTGGNRGAVQTFFLPFEHTADPGRADALGLLDAVTYLSREVGAMGIWPAVDPLASTSRLLDPVIVGQEHWEVAQRVRETLRQAAALEQSAAGGAALSGEEGQLLSRVRKLRRFFAQPFVVAEPFTRLPGRSVSRAETVRACKAILDGDYDAVPEEAFLFAGGIDDVLVKSRDLGK